MTAENAPWPPALGFAAMRDASFYERPDTRKPKQYHVVIEVEHDGGRVQVAACNQDPRYRSGFMLCLDFGTLQLADVARNCRCQRPGCKVRWPR